jgi:hypothetical protein
MAITWASTTPSGKPWYCSTSSSTIKIRVLRFQEADLAPLDGTQEGDLGLRADVLLQVVTDFNDYGRRDEKRRCGGSHQGGAGGVMLVVAVQGGV